MNKKMIFALAAAAVVVLAVITYTSRPPASTGAEATIGAAQRAQTPQIAPADVKLADQSAQTLLQSETWDMIMKDEDLRTALQDAEIRRVLADADVRRALENQAVRRGLTDPELARQLKQRLSSNLSEAEARARGINWKKMNAALSNEAIARSLRTNRGFAESLLNPRVSKGLASDALPRVLADSNFEAALRNGARFEAALRSGKQAQ